MEVTNFFHDKVKEKFLVNKIFTMKNEMEIAEKKQRLHRELLFSYENITPKNEKRYSAYIKNNEYIRYYYHRRSHFEIRNNYSLSYDLLILRKINGSYKIVNTLNDTLYKDILNPSVRTTISNFYDSSFTNFIYSNTVETFLVNYLKIYQAHHNFFID